MTHYESIQGSRGLGRRGLFREKDLERRGISHSWMEFFETLYGFVRHGRGVWSHRDYTPSRYDLLAIRFPHAVFWGPSALWLQGELAAEPEALWIAIDNKARRPRTLDPSTVILRLRHHKRDRKLLRPPGRAMTLLVHSVERARADVRTLESFPERSRAAHVQDGWRSRGHPATLSPAGRGR